MFGASGWRRHLVIAVSIVLTFQAVSVSPSAAQTQGPADRQPQPAETIVSPPAHELTRLAEAALRCPLLKGPFSKELAATLRASPD